MEQLVWAIIIILFIIFTVLKNRAKSKQIRDARKGPESDEKRVENKEDRIGKYLERIFGIELPKIQPQIIEQEEIPVPAEENIVPEIEQGPIQEERPKPETYGPSLSIKTEHTDDPYSIGKKKEIYGGKLSLDRLLKKDIKSAIVFSELIGPPIAKRKGHRLY